MSKKRSAIIFTLFSLVVLFFFTYIIGLMIEVPSVIGARNATVETTVNVTNTEPNITSVRIIPDPITLTANSTTTVWCNATIFEYNGLDDINLTNATLYDASVSTSDGADDNNYHYTNGSCFECTEVLATYNYTCGCKFEVEYYANNGSQWTCNFTVKDDNGTTDSLTNITTINGLLAIATPDQLDYGNLSVSQTSDEKELNITNVGNIDLNISVRGFANDTGTGGTNITMNCDFGEIPETYQRYSMDTGTDFDEMFNVTNVSNMIYNFTIPQKTEDNVASDGENSTYWRLEIPYTIGGFCNGSLEFIATDAS